MHFLVGFVFMCVGSSIFLLIPRCLGKLIDEHSPASPATSNNSDDAARKDPLLLAARYFREHPWAIVAVLFVGAAAICGRIYFMRTAGQLVINDLRTNVFKTVLQEDMKFFDRNKVGEIVSRTLNLFNLVQQAFLFAVCL